MYILLLYIDSYLCFYIYAWEFLIFHRVDYNIFMMTYWKKKQHIELLMYILHQEYGSVFNLCAYVWTCHVAKQGYNANYNPDCTLTTFLHCTGRQTTHIHTYNTPTMQHRQILTPINHIFNLYAYMEHDVRTSQ